MFYSLGDSATTFWCAAVRCDRFHFDLATLVLQARGEFIPGQTKTNWTFLDLVNLRNFLKEDET